MNSTENNITRANQVVMVDTIRLLSSSVAFFLSLETKLSIQSMKMKPPSKGTAGRQLVVATMKFIQNIQYAVLAMNQNDSFPRQPVSNTQVSSPGSGERPEKGNARKRRVSYMKSGAELVSEGIADEAQKKFRG